MLLKQTQLKSWEFLPIHLKSNNSNEMKIRQINIGTRMTLGFGIIIAFSILVGIVSLNNISKATEATHNIHMHPLKVGNAVRDINTNIIAMHRSMKDIALAETDLDLFRAERLVNEYEQEVYALFNVVFENFLGNKIDINTAFNSFSDWKPIREEVIQLWHDGNKSDATEITKKKGAAHVEKVLSDVEVMIKFANNKANELYTETIKNEDRATTTMLILLLTVLLVSVLIIALVSRSLIRPIKDLNLVAKKIQMGDLSVRNKINSNDELAKLALAFNSMTDSIESRGKVLSGLSEISKVILGKENSTDFARSLLSKFIELFNSQMATFYVLNKQTNSFEPLDSIGANVELLKTFDASNPEGDFSNVLITQEIYHLTAISKNTIFKYNSTIGEIIPKEVVSIPIIVNNQIVSIVSCANINSFSQESKDIMEQAKILINASYATLLANQGTLEYSQKLEVINQELEMQSEELQEQSEELQQQTNELKSSSDELHEQNLELEMQRRQVEEANRLKSEFLSNMSHELRTPLNSINALSKVLIMQVVNKLEEDETNYLRIIERNGKRLLSLINDILDLSKVEAGKMEVLPKLFSLNSALSLMCENLLSLADDKGLALNLTISEEIEIESDESRLYQVITNVVGNAIKFTKKGKVDITCEKIDGKAIIKVSDTGIGIDKDVLPFIFQEFRQGDGTTSRSYEGTGLGLAIARKIILALNGNISVESKKGLGSVFTIEIPLEWNRIGKILDIDNTIPNQFKKAKRTILVVDDEQHRVNEISIKLEEEGYNTLKAYSGKEAIELAKKYKPYAITLDIVMPEMAGWEVLQTLKSIPSTSKIPIIVISKTNDLEISMALGAVGYVQKPVDRKLLIDEIRKVNSMAKKIVIVDDSDIDRMQIQQVLEKENFEKVELKGGQQCLEYLKTEVPDVLILDLMMPGMDGFQVLKEIRSYENTRDLPVIVVTAKDLTDNDKEFLNGRAASVLTKGNSTIKMVKEIYRVLQQLESEVKNSKLNIDKRKKNVLIVEDNKLAILQVQKVLEKEGLSIRHANNGKEALEIVKTNIPDGIILDLMMPEMDGFEVLEKIRSSEQTRNIPVLILTAKSLTKKDLSKLSSNNIQQLIQKGDADIEELITKVNSMLGINKEIKKTAKVIREIRVEKSELLQDTSNGKPKILIIEDNPDNRITARAILGNKYNIIEAEDGELGVKMTFEEMPDLVLLDISLPKKDGFAVIQEIRENDLMKDLPVIALTAKAMKSDREKIIKAGCNEYVSKPIDDIELLEKVNRFLQN